MKYTVVDSAEYTYPDRFDYATGSNSAKVITPRGGYASFQIVLGGLPADGAVSVTAVGFGGCEAVELYSLYPVLVEKNLNITKENALPDMPQRIAPFQINDALMPYRGKLKVTDGNGGLYVAVKAGDVKPGIVTGEIVVGELHVPVEIEVFDVDIPAESLKIIQGYTRNFSRYHGAESPAEVERLDREYLKQLRRMRQNMMYVGGVECRTVGENKYEFDFSKLEKDIKTYLAAGMKYFNGPSVGWRKSWNESTIMVNRNIPAMSYEGYCYLTQYLPALHEFLEQRGWLDIFVMGVADEPNDKNCTEFRALCGLIRKIVPDIKLIDAMSYGNLHGSLNIWVPLNAEYNRHQKEIESLRANGDEIWQYVCCVPRANGYINRFMDYSLLATRYLFWGNYKYNLTGYLHWAVNCYQNGVSADGTEYHQNPFLCNCPEHHNTDSVCFLPAGDTHLLYPGGYDNNGTYQEPWMSIRSENQRMSAEEYELFRLLASKDKIKADAICGSVFRAFNDVDFDVANFNKARRALLEALSE